MVDETPETPDAGSAETSGTHERHASWMELFFDLVAVAGIGQLTHLLHRGPSLGDVGLYVVLYLAFWMVWACITLYGNIARDQTRVALMLAAMLGLGLMAAAVLGLAFAAFVILAGLWALTLLFGFVPRLMTEAAAGADEPWQRIMLTHCGITGGLATLAAGLGLALDHAHGHLSTGVGWALCGGAACYFAVIGLSGVRSGAGWRWTLVWPLPCAVLAVLLGFFAPHLTALPLVGAVAALVIWPLLWETWAAGKWGNSSGPDRPRRVPRGSAA
ncbi:low temperature requirement protein A [Nocardia tengchongensis]|uniref:low temperature requirement protein A n=1 Tax=Nocardia tengchongensis TaxID=2055889 RepID=UPI003605ED38